MTQLQAAGRFGPLFGQPQQPGQGSPGGAEGDKKEGGDAKEGGPAANGDAGKAKGPVQSREYIEYVDPRSGISANFHMSRPLELSSDLCTSYRSLFSILLSSLHRPSPPPPFPPPIPLTPTRCMRRLQSNLAYLAFAADRAYKPADQIPRFPAIMEPPSSVQGNMISDESMAELRTMYEKMKELFPDYGRSRGEGASALGGGSGGGTGTGTPVGQGQRQSNGMPSGAQTQGQMSGSQAQVSQTGQAQGAGGTPALATTAS